MSMRKAIDAKCRECIVDERAKGTWRAQVEACTSRNCPLYEFRPVSTVNRDQNRPKQPIPEGLRRYQEQQREK